MKGLIFDIRSFSVHDGPGIRTTVFFKGCPLRCSWCHNPESYHCRSDSVRKIRKLGNKSFEASEVIGYEVEAADIMSKIEADKPFFEESGGGLTLSGGEPLMQPAFAVNLLKLASENGIHTALDTSGYAVSETFRQVAHHTDLILFDLKIADTNAHKQHTGQGNALILENLRWLSNSSKRFFIRIPLIPDITDTARNIEGLYQIIKTLGFVERIDLLPFHQLGKSKYERLGLPFAFNDQPAYDRSKSETIQTFFGPLAQTVGIGG